MRELFEREYYSQQSIECFKQVPIKSRNYRSMVLGNFSDSRFSVEGAYEILARNDIWEGEEQAEFKII